MAVLGVAGAPPKADDGVGPIAVSFLCWSAGARWVSFSGITSFLYLAVRRQIKFAPAAGVILVAGIASVTGHFLGWVLFSADRPSASG